MTAPSISERLITAYNDHDAAAIAALYAPDGVHVEVSRNRDVVGGAAIAEGLSRFFGWFPDARWQPASTLADGNERAIRYELTGTLSSDLGPFRAEGQPISIRGILFVRSKDDLITRTEDYWDEGTFLKQIKNISQEK